MTKRSVLKKIAKDLEDHYVNIADDENDPKLLKAFASAISAFGSLADDSESSPVDDLHAIAALATAFDNSGDSELQKEAELLDEFLLSIASPKSALAGLNEVYDKELEQLRSSMRSKDREEKYINPKKELDEMYGNKEIAEAVEKQVNVKRPLQEPLSTRYSPDLTGVSLMRITDRVYQDPITGKIYDYGSGYKKNDGTVVPGGGVDQQIPDISQHQSRSLFVARNGLNSSAGKTSDIEK